MSRAQFEGIATNGTDVWLLENYSHEVFKFTGAAGRRSGGVAADSRFNLAKENTNAKDIVTDGTALWVVDDGPDGDKVYKYSLTGKSLGNWTIDPANAHPTGITVNPAGASDIWIVDNGTDKVYQYVGAASRTSGSQNAAATFALAPGDTNPQGIADPPAPDTFLSAGDGLSAATAPPAVRQLTDAFATPWVLSAALAPALAGWLVPTTQVPAPSSGRGDQPAFTAAAALPVGSPVPEAPSSAAGDIGSSLAASEHPFAEWHPEVDHLFGQGEALLDPFTAGLP
jgi:hypothetical protein